MCTGLGCRDPWTSPPSTQTMGLQARPVLLTTGLTQAMMAAPAPLPSRLRGTRCPTELSLLALNAGHVVCATTQRLWGWGREEKKASGPL